MNGRSWWELAIQWTVWAIVMTVVMGWLARSRFPRKRLDNPGALRHPTSTLVMGVVCFCFLGALSVISATTTNKTATWWTTTIFAGFAASSLVLILDYFMARHQVSNEGLAYRKLLGKTGFVKWTELKKVRYASALKWFRIETTSGEVVRVSAMLMGLPEFAEALLRSAPLESMNLETRQILRATAEGNPPSIWL
ncbi:MAG: PH domain-containing protein [Acidobacteria bacterium]|nr:PH domain-containing protein [Acidobacteriota bacterium]